MNTAYEIMQCEVCTVTPETSIKDAYLLMKGNDIRHLPVTDMSGKVVGILSDRDIQRAMEVKMFNEYQQEIYLPPGLVVSNFMSWPVYTARPSTTIKSVAESILKEKISAVVVLDSGGKLTGILTTTDLLAFLVDLLSSENTAPKWTQWTLGKYLKQTTTAV